MTGSRRRVTVGGVALSFLLAIVIGISGVIAPGGGAALAASTTLTIIDGEVLVSQDGGPFQAAHDGAVLGPGDVIRTAAGARAVLTYFEGSTVSIEPSSELAIDAANANPDGSTVVVMTQNLGRTWHVVSRLISGGSKYEVRTPSATASVRGTAFEVGVERSASGEVTTSVATTEGVVAASAPATQADPQPQPVVVAAGFRTSARAGERRLETPTLSPDADRRVSITIGSSNSLVVDPLGRANGFRDGRLVLQTPGAEVTRLAGTLQITLPGLPDGKLSTVVHRAEGAPAIDVPVITTVHEKGKPSSLLQDSVRSGETVSGVEVRRGQADGAAELRSIGAEERKDLRAPKVAAQPRLRATAAVFRPGLGASRVLASIAEERNPGASGEGAGFVRPLPFPDTPNPGASQREESRRQDEARRTELDASAAEQLERAAEQAGDAAENAQQNAESGQQRANAEQARAAAAAAAAEAARQRAIQQAAQAANAQQRRAAEDAARKAEEEKKAAEAERVKAEQEAKQKAEEAAKAERAKKVAEELARLAKEQAEKLRRQQEEQRAGTGGGSATSGGGGGGTGSGGSGGTGSGNSGGTGNNGNGNGNGNGNAGGRSTP